MEHFSGKVVLIAILICHMCFFLPVSSTMAIGSSSTDHRGRHRPNLDQDQHHIKDPKNNTTFSAIFVFGDSTVDPGNNNYIATPFKGNFAPYGQDFPGHVATGRFSNGRLTTDFIASYLGIKDSVPPYLDWTISDHELMTGVSFASALTGFDPLTAQLSGVIPMETQMEYLREYRSRIVAVVGEEKAREVIGRAVYVVSAATNDFVVNYFTLGIRKATFTVAQYQRFILQSLHQFITELTKEGARNIAVVGMPPIGCLPIVITLYTRNLGKSVHHQQRPCLESLSSVAREYNRLLQMELNATSHELSATMDMGGPFRLYYIDIYDQLEAMIRNPTKFGFEEVSRGCCGTGYLEASLLCNPLSLLCDDDSKYLFWDSIHPTERAYYLLFKSFRPIIDSVMRGGY